MSKRIPRHENETRLEGVARRWLNSTGTDGGYDDGARGAARDLFYGGCSSGIVSDLIYYCDTIKFYRKHRDEIGAMLAERCDDFGCDASGLFRDFDKSDPLATETHNQNLLAWFGFEEAARRVCDRAGIEV